ncbi:Uncharacterized protein HZ326_1521 [Fusarium oxysporum f. sp. albedinis]|nr:Uncharacterized protein HZ326_1521 [Fusarium oxysporum f. sp. albedinis]
MPVDFHSFNCSSANQILSTPTSKHSPCNRWPHDSTFPKTLLPTKRTYCAALPGPIAAFDSSPLPFNLVLLAVKSQVSPGLSWSGTIRAARGLVPNFFSSSPLLDAYNHSTGSGSITTILTAGRKERKLFC